MNISSEAVESAAKALFEVRDDPYDMEEWDDIDSTEREPYLCQARAALEAAAPHIAAQAWEECERAEYEIKLNADGSAWEPVKANPYRPAGAGA